MIGEEMAGAAEQGLKDVPVDPPPPEWKQKGPAFLELELSPQL